MILIKIIKKIILGVFLIVGIALLALLFAGIVGYFYHPGDPPSLKDAPWMIQVSTQSKDLISSHTFYAKDITSYKGTPAIANYYYSDGSRWLKVSDKVPKKAVETPTNKIINGIIKLPYFFFLFFGFRNFFFHQPIYKVNEWLFFQ